MVQEPLAHPWDGLGLVTLKVRGPRRETGHWSPNDRKKIDVAGKSPESCQRSNKGGMDSSVQWQGCHSLATSCTLRPPQWWKPPASLLSALSLQCCQSLSSLLTHPTISGTWIAVRPALCRPGEKVVPCPPQACPSLHGHVLPPTGCPLRYGHASPPTGMPLPCFCPLLLLQG